MCFSPGHFLKWHICHYLNFNVWKAHFKLVPGYVYYAQGPGRNLIPPSPRLSLAGYQTPIGGPVCNKVRNTEKQSQPASTRPYDVIANDHRLVGKKVSALYQRPHTEPL